MLCLGRRGRVPQPKLLWQNWRCGRGAWDLPLNLDIWGLRAMWIHPWNVCLRSWSRAARLSSIGLSITVNRSSGLWTVSVILSCYALEFLLSRGEDHELDESPPREDCHYGGHHGETGEAPVFRFHVAKSAGNRPHFGIKLDAGDDEYYRPQRKNLREPPQAEDPVHATHEVCGHRNGSEQTPVNFGQLRRVKCAHISH